MIQLQKNIVRFNTLHNDRYNDETKSVLWDYVSGFVTDINNYLRQDEPIMTTLVINQLDESFVKYGITRMIDVYRTVELDYLENVYGITISNISSKIGHTFTHKGYTSTAASLINPWRNNWMTNEAIIHITSLRTYPCIVINEVFDKNEIDCSNQQEVLLPRDTTFRIVNSRIIKGKQFDKSGNLFIEVQII